MTQPHDTGMLISVMRRMLEPTTKLARMLGGCGASLYETRLSSCDLPHGGLLCHCSRQTSRAQETHEPGGSLYATSPVSR
jgi:hypothetical protein